MFRYGTVLAAAVLVVTVVANLRAADLDGVRGTTIQIKDEISFTFWTDYPHKYKVFENGAEQNLLAAPKIDAPAGWTVVPESVTITKEKATHSNTLGTTRTTYTYDQYVIRGVWKVTIPATCAEGKHAIKIEFPAVSATSLRIALDHKRSFGTPPTVSGTMKADVIVHATPQAMTAAIAQRKAEQERAKAERDRWPWYAYLFLLIPGIPVAAVLWAVGSAIVGAIRPKPTQPVVSNTESIEHWLAEYRRRT